MLKMRSKQLPIYGSHGSHNNNPNLIKKEQWVTAPLKEREVKSGWAEAIKHSFLFDKELLNMFQMQSRDIISKKNPIFTEIIKRSVQIKAEIVSKDEFEIKGQRYGKNAAYDD